MNLSLDIVSDFTDWEEVPGVVWRLFGNTNKRFTRVERWAESTNHNMSYDVFKSKWTKKREEISILCPI